ncbi:glucose dehydrogenase [FAD, quinone]-like isoform X2 [Ornithodoros turicata]|uniref:glucose dehydrogenase [FAD, quinone]-like isoform X2 n=1 Tax=Ornithodoros turicata TaxID=34597 RepID=UPI003138ABAF
MLTWILAKYAFMAAFMTNTRTPDPAFYETTRLNDTYDFIIVGGGTAGCLLANKLSGKGASVLVIEAGGVETDFTEIPAFANLQPEDTRWTDKTQTQKNGSFALNGNGTFWLRGRLLGGSSVINSMLWVRGNKYDFDTWVSCGAEGWSYDNMLEYYKKIENFTIEKYMDRKYHDDCGEIPVTNSTAESKITDALLKSCAELGYPENDYNGQNHTGCTRFQTDIFKGRRVSASKAFIRKIVKTRPNLHITLHSLATKILFDGKKAVGVQFEKNNVTKNITATKEVILSAGTVGSAQLLLLSGVGPEEELKKHSITKVAELPVGKNLHDHVVIGGLVATTKKLIESQVLKSPAAFLEYTFKATGGFTLPPLVSFSFLNTSLARPDYPDVQVTFMAGSAADPEREPYETKVIGVKQDVYDKYYKPKAGQPTFNALYLLNRPKSRGTLTLNTTDPHDSPLLDPKYLSHEDDVTMAVEEFEVACRTFELWMLPLCQASCRGISWQRCMPSQPRRPT